MVELTAQEATNHKQRNDTMTFATKEQAEQAATGKYEGFRAVFISQHYAAISGVPKGGWYLIYNCGRGKNERIAGVNA